MKINSKKNFILYISIIMAFQLVGCESKTSQESELTLEQEKQLQLEQERTNALKEIEEQEKLEEIKKKEQQKLQNKIKEIESDIESIFQYIIVYDSIGEVNKKENDKNYIPYKENTISYQKINNLKETANGCDIVLKGYINIYIEYLEKIQSVYIDVLKDLFKIYNKGVSTSQVTNVQNKYKKQLEDIKAEYDLKLIEYYNEYLVNYEKENNIYFKHPSLLTSNAYYKASVSVQTVTG